MTHSLSLRRSLIADAVISGATGLLMFLGATPLSTILSVPAELLRYAGAGLIPFTAFLAYVSTREVHITSSGATEYLDDNDNVLRRDTASSLHDIYLRYCRDHGLTPLDLGGAKSKGM